MQTTNYELRDDSGPLKRPKSASLSTRLGKRATVG